MGTPLGKRGVARDGLREARQGLCCAVTSVVGGKKGLGGDNAAKS